MLKRCGRTCVALWASILIIATNSWAQLHEDGILFLRLERDAEGVRLLEAVSRPGKLKPQRPNGAFEFEVADQGGGILYRGHYEDPLIQRFEFPHADEAGTLRSTVVEREAGEFTIRLPASASGRILRFFKRQAPARSGALAERKPIAEIQVPEVPQRLRAFAESAKASTLVSNGPPDLRINIVFLAEGFTATEEATFISQANEVLSQMMNVSPYHEYRDHFNAFAVFVESAESGSDHPVQGTFRDTYFNSSYGVGPTTRLITIPPNPWNSNFADGRGKVFEVLGQFVPEYDIAILLVNDLEYGGSGGFPAIASANFQSGELALHEIGHSFAGLADEYEEQLSGYPEIEAANTTRETRREFIKWNAWISPEVPIPTPETKEFEHQVGLFEGAYFHPSGWYRPKYDCRMRNLSKPFCEVCRETHVLTIYSLLKVIPSSSPAHNNVTVPGGGELELRVETVQPASNSMVHVWTVDGVTNSTHSGASFPASFATVGTGTHLVRVNVLDSTPFVRNDPLGRLSQSRSWLVEVVASTNLPPLLSDIPDLVIELPGQTTGQAAFEVSDPDTSPELLVFDVTSSNTNLLPSGNIIIVGNGFSRAVEVHPIAGTTGASTVTLHVSDGTAQVEKSFSVIVKNSAPQLEIGPIANQQLFSGPLDLPLSITQTSTNDLQFSGTSSNPEILPDSGIQFEESEGEWMVTLLPATGAAGEITVTITTTDGIAVASAQFRVVYFSRPAVVADPPRVTSEGVFLSFSSDIPVAMVLEFSADLRFWTPVMSEASATMLEYPVKENGSHPAGFYRLRLLPL